MPAVDEKLLEVGVVAGTHGLRGELRVRPLSGNTSALLDATRVSLAVGAAGAKVEYKVLHASPYKAQIRLQLAGLEHISVAEGLVGSRVFMRQTDLGELPDDTRYWFQLAGLNVVDRQRGTLGTLDDLFTTPAHDIYVVNGPYGEVLIPAVAALVIAIDLEARQMTVDLPEGLIPDADDL